MSLEILQRVDTKVTELYDLLVANQTNSRLEQRLDKVENALYSGSGTGIVITSASIAETLQSTNYVSGSDGWKIYRAGNVDFQNGIFRGTITATSGVFTGTVYVGAPPNRIIIDGAAKAIYSENFVSNIEGWKIVYDGDAEFNNVTIRGEIRASVFVKDEIIATGGSQVIIKAAGVLLNAVTTVSSPTTFNVDIVDPPSGHTALFATSDRLRITTAGVTNWVTISSVSDQTTFYRYVCTLADGSATTWQAGTAVVDYGQSGQGGILLTAELANSPYIDVFTTGATPWASVTTTVRVGNLAGISDPNMTPTGFGIYSNNVYMSGTGVFGAGAVILDAQGISLYGDVSDPTTWVKWYSASDVLLAQMVGYGVASETKWVFEATSTTGDTDVDIRAQSPATDVSSIQLISKRTGQTVHPQINIISQSTYSLISMFADVVSITGISVSELRLWLSSDGLQLWGGGASVKEFSTDGTLAGNSDTAVPTEKAAKTYVDSSLQPNNILINGSFQVAQRGTSFTSTTTPSNNDDTYLFDQWVFLGAAADAADVSQGTTTPPTGARYYARLDAETANTQFALFQPLEADNSIPHRSKTASLLLYARTVTGAAISNIRAAIIAWTGTADSITSDVVGTWAGAGTNPTLATNWAYLSTPANLALVADTWTRFVVEGVALGTSGNNLGILIWVDDTTIAVGDIVDITNVGLYISDIAPVEYINTDFGVDLLQAMRWCEILDSTTGLEIYGTGQVAAATRALASFNFRVIKRVAPTVTLSAASDWAFFNQNVTAFVTWVTVSPQISRHGVLFDVSGMAASLGGAGDAAMFGPNNTSAAKMTFDASL